MKHRPLKQLCGLLATTAVALSLIGCNGKAGQTGATGAAGANSTLKPLTTPPAGTAPGCLNDTMCHSTSFAPAAPKARLF